MSMRSHEPLIRLARFKVEELQKQLADIEAVRATILDQISRLEDSVPEEQAIAAENRDGFIAYGSYARSVIQRKEKLRISLSEVDQQTSALKARMEEAFGELKKFELLEERRLSRIEQSVREAEQAEMDEVAAGIRRRAN